MQRKRYIDFQMLIDSLLVPLHLVRDIWSLFPNIETVPTIVSAHTFCASRKTWFKRALGLTQTQSTTLLMRAKFSYCDQIKFNEPVLKLGIPE